MANTVYQPSPVLVYGNPALRRIAKIVPNNYPAHVLKGHINTLYKSMSAGVAIAAPQIGLNLRIVLLRSNITGIRSEDYFKLFAQSGDAYGVLLNPYLKIGNYTQANAYSNLAESCLSIPLYTSDVQRYARFDLYFQSYNIYTGVITDEQILNYDVYSAVPAGSTAGTVGEFGGVIQHELDHLDGKFFIDQFGPDYACDYLESYLTGDYTTGGSGGYATLPKDKY